jgi:tRNA(fMet)-specific endonuclease VapC
MTWFFDTNICINFLRGKYDAVAHIMTNTDPALIKIPAIVQAELLLGAMKSTDPTGTRKKVELFLLPFEIKPFDSSCAQSYAQIRATLEGAGQIIGPNDLLIAATALANNGILVTNNYKEFKRVADLQIENWELIDI